MTSGLHLNAVRVTSEEAARVLERAARLDASHRGDVSVAQLREAALESGITPEAFDAAVAKRAPWWVRGCMFGVPDRRAAMGFYWLFVAGLCAVPLLVLKNASAGGLARTAGIGAFLVFAAWSTSRTVRWLDAHGWNTLD